MAYATREEARDVGRELCPDGWKFRVWDNIGWHVSWRKGPVCVHENVDYSFIALISPDPNECGSGGPWTSKTASDTVLVAAAAEIAAFRDYVTDCKRTWQAIEDNLPEIEED